MSEFELKFQVPREREAQALAATRPGGGGRARWRPLVAAYYDTDDGLLAQDGMALRLRHEGRRWVQTLKRREAHSVDRQEHEVVVERAPGMTGAPALDPARHAEDPVGRRLAKLLARADAPPLVERYRTDVRRSERILPFDEGEVEVSLDRGHVVAAGTAEPILEIEFELKAGSPIAVFRAADVLAASQGYWLDVVSKAERGAHLAVGDRFGPVTKAEPPRIDRHQDAPAMLRAIVAACLAHILPNASAIAHGSPDPDHVHQARVGLRRLRTALREIGSLSALVNPAWEGQLAEVFRALGANRDDEVLPGVVGPLLQTAGAPVSTWTPAERTSTASPRELVTARDFQRTLLQLLAFAEASAPFEPPSDVDAVALLGKRLDKLHRAIAGDAKRFTELPAERQHRVRKRLKRLRYLAEFAAPLHRDKDVERYLETLRPAQEALGDHNDEATAAARFQALAERDPRALFAVGWLQARRVQSGEAGQKALKAVAKARTFW
jgi:inorganic triphosphatase YgiF